MSEEEVVKRLEEILGVKLEYENRKKPEYDEYALVEEIQYVAKLPKNALDTIKNKLVHLKFYQVADHSYMTKNFYKDDNASYSVHVTIDPYLGNNQTIDIPVTIYKYELTDTKETEEEIFSVKIKYINEVGRITGKIWNKEPKVKLSVSNVTREFDTKDFYDDLHLYLKDIEALIDVLNYATDDDTKKQIVKEISYRLALFIYRIYDWSND